MLTYFTRRLLLAIPTLLFIGLVIFLLLDLAPGDPTAQLPLTIPPAVREQIRISLGLGAAGIVLPVLPTAPFVLLAAACFMRSSERLHSWVIGHPWFGHHISDYLAGKGLRAKTKFVALVTLWASVIASTALFIPLLVADVAVIVVAIAVSAYVLRLPTCDAADEACRA